MPAVRELHAQDGRSRIARLEEGTEHRHVRRGARVRLHVGVLRTEQLLRAIDRELLDDVDVAAPAVIPASRIPFRVLVAEGRTDRGEHRRARVVLRCDQPQRGAFPLQLPGDRTGDLRIGCFQRLPVRRVLAHVQSSPRSIAAICSIRGTCRPLANGVDSQTPTISSAYTGAMIRAPMLRTFASLCSRDSRASVTSWQSAARMPSTLFAAICSPCPDPPSTIARSASPAATTRAAAAQKTG